MKKTARNILGGTAERGPTRDQRSIVSVTEREKEIKIPTILSLEYFYLVIIPPHNVQFEYFKLNK